MKRIFKSISALLLVMIIVLSMGVTALAASSTITYQGRKKGFDFAPGSSYTETDLFDNFKNVMPGDTRTEKVTIKNDYSGCDYIKVWMRAVLHDEDDNVISPEVLKELKESKKKSDNTNVSDLDYMNEFLEQLELKVWTKKYVSKDKWNENLIYSGSPDSLETGFEDGNVYLGTIRYKDSMELNVDLAVDIEMGNEFADRIGEVDWVFVIEERNDQNGGGGGGSKPSPDKIEVVEPIEPQAPMLPNLPKTGDETVTWPYILLLGLGVVGMILTMFKKRKKEQ